MVWWIVGILVVGGIVLVGVWAVATRASATEKADVEYENNDDQALARTKREYNEQKERVNILAEKVAAEIQSLSQDLRMYAQYTGVNMLLIEQITNA